MFNPMTIMQFAPLLISTIGELFPEKKKQTEALVGALSAGAQIGSLFASPSTGLKIGSELSKSTVGKLSTSDGGILPRIVGMGKGGDLTQPGLFNSMQIGSSGISNSVGKNIPTLHNPFDLF